jgi:hypothetical protein
MPQAVRRSRSACMIEAKIFLGEDLLESSLPHCHLEK